MSPETITKLNTEFAEDPETCATSQPSEIEIACASTALGVRFSSDYIEFLRLYGGGLVGARAIFGLRTVPALGKAWNVVDETRRYRKIGVPAIDHWVIVSDDDNGNPIGTDASGAVWIYDFEYGAVEWMFPSFEDYIRYAIYLAEEE